MAYIVLERRSHSPKNPNPSITIGTSGNLILNVVASRVVHNSKASYCEVAFDEDTYRLALRLKKEMGENTYKFSRSGGKSKRMGIYYSISGKTLLAHPRLRYDFRVRKTYPANIIDAKSKDEPPTIEIKLATDRIKPVKATE